MQIISYGEPSLYGNSSDSTMLMGRRKCDNCWDCNDCDDCNNCRFNDCGPFCPCDEDDCDCHEPFCDD